MEYINDISNIPKDNYHIYHATRRGCEKIVKDGLDNSKSNNKWGEVNRLIELVEERENINNLPRKRSNCNFLFSRYTDISCMKDRTVIVVDLSKSDIGKLHRGSYHKVTQIYEIVKNKDQTPKEILKKSDREAEDAYRKTVEYIKSLKTEKPPIDKGGEIIVPEKIKPKSISHVYNPY